ncbi:thap domain [Holotrichia oblita]|uniref:Thap domain n=1 Tax=Holotrichia oblita TaxID=644536 RepID=A0ACB9STI8_HOLOL|nr:thap domain [Holotrichia oblita]
MVHVCCVRGCEDKQSTRHRFPNPTKNTFLYNTCLTLAGNESLLTKNPEDVYKNHRVCHIHFRKEDISSNMYLKKDTFPSLFLPRESTTERPGGNNNICTNTSDKILKHRYSACIEYEEHYYCKPFIGETVSSPSTFEDSTARTVNVVDKPSTSKEIPHAEGERRLVAMWEDIYNAYKIDNGSGQLRAMPKLTEGHVNPHKLRKMKVSCASQVFSHNVASVMALMARVELTGLDGTKMRSNASDTPETLQFFDELFDSVNGMREWPERGKKYKCMINDGSGHMQFWQDAKYHLRNMYFQRPGTQENIRPPSLKNWVISLNGLEEVFKAVQCKGVRYIRPRDFNQDPVENFFGQIRQQGVRDTNPTASMFTYHFRTALVNGMVTQHSLSANCEEDDSYNILNGLRDSVSQETSANVIVREDVNISLPSEELTTYVDKLSNM